MRRLLFRLSNLSPFTWSTISPDFAFMIIRCISCRVFALRAYPFGAIDHVECFRYAYSVGSTMMNLFFVPRRTSYGSMAEIVGGVDLLDCLSQQSPSATPPRENPQTSFEVPGAVFWTGERPLCMVSVYHWFQECQGLFLQIILFSLAPKTPTAHRRGLGKCP